MGPAKDGVGAFAGGAAASGGFVGVTVWAFGAGTGVSTIGTGGLTVESSEGSGEITVGTTGLTTGCNVSPGGTITLGWMGGF